MLPLQLKTLQQKAGQGKVMATCGTEELRQKALAALKTTYGYEGFRGKQEEAVLGALQGRDVFVLMPTGAGKSMCYTLPPLVRQGVALVVSPLLALMEDQVHSLRARGVRAEYLASTLDSAQRAAVMADLQAPHPATQLLFVTPELLATQGFKATLQYMYAKGSLLLVAVDEAHCISSYGHDFRPTYRQLGALRQELARVPLMALTATASARVQDDIVRQLRLRDPLRLASSFNRPNIHYEVRCIDAMTEPGSGGKEPLRDPLPDLVALLEGERRASPSGQLPCCIIYTHKRETADAVAAALRGRGVPCEAYHAGMPASARSAVVAGFSQGRVQCVAATTAFGMGIDRADVRLVVHYNLPASIEGFYQESGRAGRDGATSRSVLYFSLAALHSMEFIFTKSQQEQLKRKGSGFGGGGSEGGKPTQLQALGTVREYCLHTRCRRSFLLGHFGERVPPGAPDAACCDACGDPEGVAAVSETVKAAGVARRQRPLGGRHTLNLEREGGGGGRGGALEFETGRPSEGLDYDGDGAPASFFEEEDIELSDEEGAEGEASGQVQAALKRARTAGSRGRGEAGVLAALEAAEQRYDRQEAAAEAGQGSKSRLLAKLEGDSPGGCGSKGGSSAAASGGVPESLRQKVRAQLLQAIGSNACLAAALGCQGAQAAAEAAAAALEQQCWQGVQSATVYRSKASAMVLQLKKAQQPGAVPQLAAVLTPPPGEQPAGGAAGVGGSSSRGSSLPEAQPPSGQLEGKQQGSGQAVIDEDELARLMGDAQGAPVAATPSTMDAEAAARAVAALRRLAAARVSAQQLLQTGAGKQVRALRKHPNEVVAAAAGQVYDAWRAAVQTDTAGR